MRKLRISILSFIALLFLLAPMMMPIQPVKAAWAVRHYTVWENCVVSPVATEPVGEWTRECDGNWVGWGDMPGTSCTRYDLVYGETCDQ